MRKINISSGQIDRASTLYPFNNLNGSIMGGRSNIYGALGEIVVYDMCVDKVNVELVNTYDYDMIFDNGIRADVKTKRTTVIPRDHYNCTIAAFNTQQACDMYIFCRVSEDLSIAYILGYKKKYEFFEEAIFNRKGEIDGAGGWVFKDDCYNLTIDKLDKIGWDYV